VQSWDGNPLIDDPPYPPIGKAGKASDPDAATARPFDQIDPGENRFAAGNDIIDNYNALADSDSISLDRQGAPLRVGHILGL
jgi:hypothetical protein